MYYKEWLEGLPPRISCDMNTLGETIKNGRGR